MAMVEFRTKSEARKYVKAQGYTILHEVGQCGDYAHGSREYYVKENSRRNQHGALIDSKSISKLPGGWCTFDH